MTPKARTPSTCATGSPTSPRAETLAVDLHSHGRAPAFWSADDDADDNGVRVCGVFGHLDRAQPTAKFRLVLNGHFVTLPSSVGAGARPGRRDLIRAGPAGH